MDDEDLDLDTLYARFKLESALEDIERALHMAEIRSLPVSALLHRVPALLSDDRREQIIYRLQEVTLSPQEAEHLASLIRQMAIEWNELPSRAKARADAILARLIRALPDHDCFPIALEFIRHPRKTRRAAVCKILRGRELPVHLAEELVGLYRENHDQSLLELVARNPPLVEASDESFLLSKIADPYWQMRVIEALLRVAPSRAIALATDHPRWFVHAVGRTEERQHLPLARQLLLANREDTEFIAIYTWALGKIGDRAAFHELISVIEDLKEKLRKAGG